MQTKVFAVNYHIVNAEGKTAEAFDYNGGGWTPIYSLSGHTGFTAHFVKLPTLANQLEIQAAYARLVWQSTDTSQPNVRLLTLHYDANNAAVFERDWATFSRRPAYNPDNQGVDITDKLRSLLNGSKAAPQIGLEVNGSGVIHEAVIEVQYAIKDYSDDVAALLARVAALEGAGPATPPIPDPVPSTGPLNIVVPPEGVTVNFTVA